jgi:hypothetical protein
MLENIFQMIISPELQQALLPLKAVLLVLSFLALVLIIYFLFITSYLKFRFLDELEDYLHWKHYYSHKAVKKAYLSSVSAVDLPEPLTKESFSVESSESKQEEPNFKDGRVERTDWERISDKLESGNELNYKLALIDADKFFNQELEKQRKELSKKVVSNADNILKAKDVLEKMLVHPRAELSLERAKELIASYQKALSELKAI